MSKYIQDQADEAGDIFEQAVTMAMEFLSSDSQWEELARPLGEYLWEHQLPGRISECDETGMHFWDGSGEIFLEAKRRLLVTALGAEGYENAIRSAERLCEKHIALTAQVDAVVAEMAAFGNKLWGVAPCRPSDVFDLAEQRLSERTAEPEGRT